MTRHKDSAAAGRKRVKNAGQGVAIRYSRGLAQSQSRLLSKTQLDLVNFSVALSGAAVAA